MTSQGHVVKVHVLRGSTLDREIKREGESPVYSVQEYSSECGGGFIHKIVARLLAPGLVEC